MVRCVWNFDFFHIGTERKKELGVKRDQYPSVLRSCILCYIVCLFYNDSNLFRTFNWWLWLFCWIIPKCSIYINSLPLLLDFYEQLILLVQCDCFDWYPPQSFPYWEIFLMGELPVCMIWPFGYFWGMLHTYKHTPPPPPKIWCMFFIAWWVVFWIIFG